MAEVGNRFAYRERAHTPGEPVRPVEMVKEGPPRSQKVRIRWLSGEYEGLEEWVPKVRLIAPWDEAEALLEDERRMLAAVEASGDMYGTVTWEAVQMVYWSLDMGDAVGLGYKAMDRELLVIEDLDATAQRLGLQVEKLVAEPHAYVDRFGNYKAPFQVALRVAKHCCRRFAQDVLRYVQAEEDALKQAIISRYYVAPHVEGIEYEVYPEKMEERLREQEPIFALIQGWCGQEAIDEFNQVLALREEVKRLREMVEATARWLRDAGHPVKAGLLLKEWT